MKEETVTDAALRQFLLGDVDDQERQRIESLLLTDELARERILTAEQDLIEDYLEDALTPPAKEKFLQHYAGTAAQQRKLRITKSIKDWAGRQQKVAAAGASQTFWGRLTARLGLKPMLVIPLAATAAIAIVIAIVWLNSRTEQQNRQAALEQEIARLNEPASLRQVPRGLLSLTLRSRAVRDLEAQQELVKSADTPTVELRLVWSQKEHYPHYRTAIRRLDSNDSLKLPDLAPESDGNTIRLRLPARFLTRGIYQIVLTGVSSDGSNSPSEEYQFTVSP